MGCFERRIPSLPADGTPVPFFGPFAAAFDRAKQIFCVAKVMLFGAFLAPKTGRVASF
jgi:hypothetical protein